MCSPKHSADAHISGERRRYARRKNVVRGCPNRSGDEDAHNFLLLLIKESRSWQLKVRYIGLKLLFLCLSATRVNFKISRLLVVFFREKTNPDGLTSLSCSVLCFVALRHTFIYLSFCRYFPTLFCSYFPVWPSKLCCKFCTLSS